MSNLHTHYRFKLEFQRWTNMECAHTNMIVPSDRYHRLSLMKIQHCFRCWLGAVIGTKPLPESIFIKYRPYGVWRPHWVSFIVSFMRAIELAPEVAKALAAFTNHADVLGGMCISACAEKRHPKGQKVQKVYVKYKLSKGKLYFSSHRPRTNNICLSL